MSEEDSSAAAAAAGASSEVSPIPIAAASTAGGDSVQPSEANTQRTEGDETRPSSARQGVPSASTARPSAPVGSPGKVVSPSNADLNEEASEASKLAAAEAEAEVKKSGAVPNAPAGLMTFGAGGVNETLLGLGAAPVLHDAALVTVPRLDDLIIKALADNYHICPAFDWIPPEYLENVIALLQPGKLDFPSAASLVQTEKYWQRMSCERWNAASLDLALHGQSWKRLYCEKHLKEVLEKYHHSTQQINYKRLLKEVEACKPYVHRLQLGELMSHLDLSDLLFDFPNLSSLQLKFGAKELGMDYDRSMFGASLSDAHSLSKLMAHSSSINRLTLSENLLTDEHVLILMRGLNLESNHTLTHLDLSRNRIGDIGARKLATLLDGGISQSADGSPTSYGVDTSNTNIGSVLVELNLNDNAIRTAGAIAFGNALQYNRGLKKLDLSLNSLEDDGGVAVFNGLTQHTTLKELALSACNLSGESYESLLNLLKFNRSLEGLHLSCNELSGGVGGLSLLDAFKQNEQIVALDLRRNGLNPNVEAEVKQILAKRMAVQKQAARKAFQKDWDAAM